MLRVRFINVGDGDAILIEELEGDYAFRMLVDTGREVITGGERCADFLAREGIARIDVLVITHLHEDHAGGIHALLPGIAVAQLYAGYIPAKLGTQIPPEPQAPDTIQGMIRCVNRWSQAIGQLRSQGCAMHEVLMTKNNLRLTPGLRVDLIVPDHRTALMQREIWDAMLSRVQMAQSLKYRASKSRNPNSLRVRVRYMGRSMELAGDCYAGVWENEELAPCDVFKVPHHGDKMAVTRKLVKKLRPAYAVISCGKDYIARKDRPSADTLRLLRAQGTRVWFTDSYTDGTCPPHDWKSVDFTIQKDGTILAPAE